MALDTTAAANVLKIDYLPGIREQLNNKVLMYSRLQRNTEDFVGSQGYIALHVGRSSGVGSRAENGLLPDAGVQQYNKATFDMKHHYARIEISGPVMERTSSDMGAYIRAVDSEVKGAVMDLQQDLSRQCLGDASCSMADPADGTLAAATTIVVDSVRNLEVGMYIDLIETDTGLAPAGYKRKITAIDQSTKTITVDVAVAANFTANTQLVRAGNYGNEMFGLAAIINSSDPPTIAGATNYFGNIARGTSTNYWRGNMVNAASADLSLDLMQQCIDVADQQSNGEITLILTDYDQWRKYAKILIPDRRFPTADGNAVKLNGGFQALQYDEMEVVKDKYMPASTMYFIDENTMFIFELSDFDWMDKDGAILSRTPNKDAYEATLRAYQQIACEAPRSSTKLYGLAA